MTAAADYEVLTPERVSLQYDVAGIGTRSAAAVVDLAIQSVLLAGVLVAAVAGGVMLDLARRIVPFMDDAAIGVTVVALFILALFLVFTGYGILFEIVWNGQTPGKRLLGIRVMRENGYPVRAVDVVIRNLVKLVDGPPAMYVVGITVMLFNNRAKRPGDFAAGTVVVREGRKQSLSAIAAAAAATGGQVPTVAAGLAASDASLVRDFLSRRASLTAEARTSLAARLAGALAARYGLENDRTRLGDEPFLEALGA